VVTIGDNIKRIIEARGLSQTDVADALKIRQPSVNKLTKAGLGTKAQTLIKYALVLQCSVEDLLAGVDPAYDAWRKLDHDKAPTKPQVSDADLEKVADFALHITEAAFRVTEHIGGQAAKARLQATFRNRRRGALRRPAPRPDKRKRS
jgi:transcriptional regulator with XRE-family HTH domain